MANPEPGTILVAPAGSQAEALFDFVNEAPFVAAFHLEVEGLPGPEWAPGAGPDAKMMAAAAGGGTLRLVLTPPPDTATGDYTFKARIVSDGAIVGTGPVPLILRVEPGLGREATEPATPAEAESIFSAPANQVISEPEDGSHAAATVRPAEAADVTRSNGAGASVLEAVAATPLLVTPVPVAPVPVAPERTSAPPPESVPDPPPASHPRAVAQPVTPVRPAVRPEPAKTPPLLSVPPPSREEELALVDLPEAEEQEKEELIAERSLLDPRDGTTLSLRPGETLLLRFGFTNDIGKERLFVIEEDRSLDSTWINIVQDQIHLMPNAHSELSVRLSPPPNADPGAYPFQVRVGPTGGVLTPCNLTLNVAATPAVRLKAETPRVQAGPFARAVDFKLFVERAGNADTAFRIAVKAPRPKTEDDDGQGQPGTDEFDVYETARWRYLFDREMASLESPTQGRAPKPEPIRLRLQRKGTWWLGFRESHQVRVAAVPVTDPANGGKPGNVADLAAVRWRLLPLPGFVAAPLALLALLLLGGTASNLRVVKPTYEAPDGVHYVVAVPQNNTVKARLDWDAPWYALLRLTGGGESTGFVRPPEDIRAVFSDVGQRSIQREYRLTPLLGSPRAAKVRFVRARGDTPLEIAGAQRRKDGSYLLAVPAAGATLTLRNRAAQFNRINYWVAKGPSSPAFRVSDLLLEGSLDPLARGGAPLVIKVRPGESSGGGAGTDELVFVTTDAAHTVVTVKLASASKR